MSYAVYVPSAKPPDEPEIRFKTLKEIRADRVKIEVAALCHVLRLPEDERLPAAERLVRAASELAWTTRDVARALHDTPNIGPADVARMWNRPPLRAEAAAVTDAAMADIASVSTMSKPDDLAYAYELVVGRDTASFLPCALPAPDARRRTAMAPAVSTVKWTELTGVADAWRFHVESIRGEPAGARDGVMLDPSRRGAWANWFNAHLGPRGALEPGYSLVVEGHRACGKTSLVAALAVDALAAGCPAWIWQPELRKCETLEHLMAQLPGEGEWWNTPFHVRARRELPGPWGDLLTIVSDVDVDTLSVANAMQTLSLETVALRQTGKLAHACNGLVIVDQVQHLVPGPGTLDESPSKAQAAITSRLARTARDAGVSLIMVSSLAESAAPVSPVEAWMSGPGAEIMNVGVNCVVRLRPAHSDTGAAVGLWPVEESFEQPTVPGETYLMSWEKTRGVLSQAPEYTRPGQVASVRCFNRALYVDA